MKIYVAGKLSDAPRVIALQETLQGMGHTITHDWTPEIAKYAELRAHPAATENQHKKFKARCGEADIQGVEQADILIWLYNDGSRGAFVELGVALALNKPVFVLKEEPFYYSDTVFLFTRGVTIFRTMQDLMDHIHPNF